MSNFSFSHLVAFSLCLGSCFTLVMADTKNTYSLSNQEKSANLLNLLATDGLQEYSGEPVSQLEHALQCANQAQLAGADRETIIAALFHDIGHLCADENTKQMDGYGIESHEQIGAQYLRKQGFSNKICQLVLGHVEAKRYLIAKHTDYYEQLSEASKQTLARQGGQMSPLEVLIFEKDPLFKEKIQMRLWDEQAKIKDLAVPNLDTYRSLILSHLNDLVQSLGEKE